MSLFLTAFLNDTFVEKRLPNINDSDYEEILEKNIYNLKSDIKIKLEVINHNWTLFATKDYDIIFERHHVDSLNLNNGVTFGLKTVSGDQILIIAIPVEEEITAKYKIDLSSHKKIKIGSKNDNDIIYNADLISGHHLEIIPSNGKTVIKDISSNGVFVNSKKIKGEYELHFGDCIYAFGLRLYYYGKILAVSCLSGDVLLGERIRLMEEKDETISKPLIRHKKEYFNRAPRIIDELYTEKIDIEGPDKADKTEEKSLLSTIGPSFTMVLPMALGAVLTASGSRTTAPIGLITALGSAIVGVFWGIINFRKEKKSKIKKEQDRFQVYSDYLRKTADFIDEKYKYNINCLNTKYPSANDCLKYNRNSAGLWSRNLSHDDFLSHRIGLGKTPFQASINIPKSRFEDGDDELMRRPGMIKEKYAFLDNVPSCVDLNTNRIVGIVGGKDKTGAYNVVKNLIIQVASANCYSDVKLCMALDKSNSGASGLFFSKWLPHVWSDEKKERYYSETQEEASDMFFSLSNIVRIRAEQSEVSFGKKVHVKPHYILIIDNQEYLEGEPLSKYIFDGKEEYGLTTIFLSDTYERLPNNCQCIIYNIESAKGIYTPKNLSSKGLDVVFDIVDDKECEDFARRLSGIEVKEIEIGGELPNSLSFLEMYRVSKVPELNVIDRWIKNRTYTSMKALVGWKSGGTDCYLDIHEKYHGPHGLVAGTTGSGKSETLQTYILSLAVNFSPNDISFFIIDFKGGGMANLFSDLPHMAGQISNLSGNQVRRAMLSITSENLRRQRIFADSGAHDIIDYTRMYKNGEVHTAVPHLFIIIDEFAELKREEPEFMKELISVAQIGRSLGVHLILATQKPSGTVDDNIRSNSKFKLCLRVQDRQDSKDMISKPDAAYLTQAGRCFLQVGNDEIFELFQSGWSGAVYDEKTAGIQSNIAGLIVNTGRIVMSGSKTTAKRKEEIRENWLLEIINIIRDMSLKSDYDLNKINNDSALTDSFISLLFKEFENNDIKYYYNAINVKCLINLIKLYNLSFGVSDKDLCKSIIDASKKHNIKIPEMKDVTQLDAIVEHICRVAEEENYPQSPKLWLPVIPEKLYLKDVISEKNDVQWSLSADIGMCDDPYNQAQFPYTVDFSENGHLAVYGSVVSGKSTFLQTLVWSMIKKYKPDEFNFYALDFSNHMLQPFESDVHCGGIMYENDIELISKFFYMVSNMLSERKKLIRGGSFNQYIRAGNEKCPAVVILIDNYAAFKEKTDGNYDDILLEISRDGAGFGIYLVISAGGIGINELSSKIADNIKVSVALGLNDNIKYSELLGIHQLDILPEENIKGRGLVVVGSRALEFQAALCFEASDDYKRSEQISDYCKKYARSYTGNKARAIPFIPENPQWQSFTENSFYIETKSNPDLLPFGYDKETADMVSIDFRETFCYLIGGNSRSGRTNVLKIMMASAKEKNLRTVLIDKEDESLKAFANKYCDTYISKKSELYEFLKDILPVFKERNQKKREYILSGLDESEVYDRMSSFEKIVIFISSATAFNKLVYTFDPSIGEMNGFVENITEKGSLHNIYFIIDVSLDEYNDAKGRTAFNNMAGYKSGVYLGGNLSAQRMFDFSSVSYSIQAKTTRSGEGVCTASNSTDVKQVIIPLAKGMI